MACAKTMTTSSVAFILKGYPRLSETFIAQEIQALEDRGVDIIIVSLRYPTDKKRHPVHEAIRARVIYLPEYLYQEPVRVLRAWLAVRANSGYTAARRQWWSDLKRDRTPNRIRRFGQALVLAHELGEKVRHLHAHFLHTPASVTRYAAIISGLPWSCSAHAKDIWTIPAWEKREKLAELQWLVTCTRANVEHLGELDPVGDRVTLVYHGLDLSRFAAPETRINTGLADGSDPAAPVQLISVGRAVKKKGYDLLIDALTRLPKDLHWRFTHIGGGSELEELQTSAHAGGIDARIDWLGAQSQSTVIDNYRAADLFVLPCRITDDGDRDGLPNVLMEAQSQGVACLSTNISGVPELIDDNVTGALVGPEDVDALSHALEQLIRDPALRARLAKAGQIRVRTEFGMDAGIDDLERRFALTAPQMS